MFRGLIIASTLCYLLVGASRWLVWDIVSFGTYQALSGSGEGAVLPIPDWMVGAVAALWVAAAVGICRFNPRARFVLAALCGFNLLLLLLGGVVTRTAFEAFAGAAGILMTGGALALAYWSPLQERFESEKPHA